MRKPTAFFAIAAGAILAGSVAFVGTGFAAKGGIPGPPAGGEVSNNLSFPAAVTESVNTITADFDMPEGAELGVHYSYGCDVPESDAQFNYPNTSCVDNLSSPTVYYTASECTDSVLPSPCQGYEVSKIYWQKVDANEWWADQDGVSPEVVSVAHVDWGDALEAVSWTESSVIRVETQPYGSTIPGFNPELGSCAEASLDPESDCKVGLQMWHVSGQGITEHWGVRANEQDVSYNYDSPFRIINTGTARLNVTKMAPGEAVCPMPGGNPGELPPPVGDWTGAAWDGTCTWMDAPYSVELSVGGKYVYGFNWRMRNVELEQVCGSGWLKTGYWRLTFYTPGAVAFDDPLASVTAPPAIPAYARELPRTEFNPPLALTPLSEDDGEEEETEALYTPVIDTVNNLTYIDICIVAKSQGGGGGGGGGGPGGGGGSARGGGRSAR